MNQVLLLQQLLLEKKTTEKSVIVTHHPRSLFTTMTKKNHLHAHGLDFVTHNFLLEML